MSTAIHAGSDATEVDRGFEEMRGRIQARFLANLADGGHALFTTDAGPSLFPAYLDAFGDPADRQYHTCHACRRFVETYGGLVVIDAGGRTRPAFWDESDAPDHYRPAVAAMARLVRRARVTGVFLSGEATWGIPIGPKNADWTHFAAEAPESLLYRNKLLTPGQAMAEKREDYGAVSRALAEFPAPLVRQALTLLESEALYRAEKVAGPARWLHELHEKREAVRGEGLARNVVWRAVALAPPGFCHPRTSMIGSLLEDLAGGLGFETVSRRFASKMHPLSYQRPQVAPDIGNIAQAEKIVERLGIARSLERRFARLDEIEAIWRPKAAEEKVAGNGGVFGHLTPKGTARGLPPSSIIPPPLVMTWAKFSSAVLPNAERIELLIAPRPNHFAALVTAVHPDAPPILQWDREDRRNPVSWYLWQGGSRPEQWGLRAGEHRRVAAICRRPSHWGDARSDHQGDGVILLLEGARESRTDTGAALFPEILKSELHAVRATIEAYSRKASLGAVPDDAACGLVLGKGFGGSWDAVVRVHSGAGRLDYRLDRWD